MIAAAEVFARPIRAVGLPALMRAAVPIIVAFSAALGTTLAVDHLAFLTFVNRFVGDWETAALLPAEPQNPDIVVVAITEDTLEQFPYRSPVDREYLSNLLTTLAARGPRAIGLDLLFDQPTEKAKDDLLRNTLGSLKVPMVVSYTDTKGNINDEQKKFLDAFVPMRLRAFSTLATDQFDTVRWTYPGRNLADGSYLRGFAGALAAKVGVDTPIPGRLVDIAWHGSPSRDVPAFKLFPSQIVPALPADWFKDKIVLIGTKLSLVDRHRTPFSTVFTGDEGMLPGVVIHAHSLAQILEGRQIPAVPWWINFALVLGCATLGAMLPAFGGSMFFRIGGGTIFLLFYWLAGGLLYHYAGRLIGLVAPTMALASAHWAMEALSGREARRQREFIKGAFSRYVSPKVVDALILDPSKMSLEGERRVMSFLFTDLADFTTMSETLDPHDLARTLNGYLDGVCEIVMKYDGTVAKFEGDAVFVIFNAPVDQHDHAERAVRCALEIDRFAESYRIEQNAHNIPFGRTRIGIHTGPAVVGNFGSRNRFDYSANGDAVNTAARLEGVNKQFGTRICISDATRRDAPGIEFRPLGAVVVKGKSKGIAVWEPLHADGGRDGYLARWRDAYAKLEAGAAEAELLLADLKKEDPADKTVALHLDRLRRGERGVELVLTEK